MEYLTGKVQGGVIVVEGEEKLEEGELVRILRGEPEPGQLTTGERLMKWAGVIKEGPPDASVNVDHYLYGHPIASVLL